MATEQENQINLSAEAARQIQEQLVRRGTPQAYLRLGVQGAGCSGFSYALRFEDAAPRPKDIILEIAGVRLVIDKKSFQFLKGCTLDWEQTLMKQGFIFINPNERSRCGCGHSFTV